MANLDIDPFIVMEVMSQAAKLEQEGADVMHMEVGQPGTGACQASVAAVTKAMTEGLSLGYTVALGQPELRQRIANHYRQNYGVGLTIDQIAITAGASGAFVLAFLAAFKKGDRVALASPGYPAYRNILVALGMEVVTLPCDDGTGFQPTVEILERVDNLAGLIVASPANPTGTMLSETELKRLTDYCSSRFIRLISDEIYHGLTYGKEATTAWSFDKQTVVINSFSKYFSMTGWRVGWMLMPPDLAQSIERLAQNLFICPPTVSQVAAAGSFDGLEELDNHIEVYQESRALLLQRLPQMGITRLAPADGAFYVYAFIGHLTDNSLDWCKQLLNEAHVAATPGVDFDQDRGHQWARFSFAGSTQTVTTALDRLEKWLQKS